MRRFTEARTLIYSWGVLLLSAIWIPTVLTHLDIDPSKMLALVRQVTSATDKGAANPPSVKDAFSAHGYRWELDWWSIVAVAISIVLALCLSRYGRRVDLSLPVGALAQTRWVEVSSPYDPVGRLLFPELPAVESMVPNGGSPLLDHVTYFKPNRSLIPWLAAREVARVLDQTSTKATPTSTLPATAAQSFEAKPQDRNDESRFVTSLHEEADAGTIQWDVQGQLVDDALHHLVLSSSRRHFARACALLVAFLGVAFAWVMKGDQSMMHALHSALVVAGVLTPVFAVCLWTVETLAVRQSCRRLEATLRAGPSVA